MSFVIFLPSKSKEKGEKLDTDFPQISEFGDGEFHSTTKVIDSKKREQKETNIKKTRGTKKEKQ